MALLLIQLIGYDVLAKAAKILMPLIVLIIIFKVIFDIIVASFKFINRNMFSFVIILIQCQLLMMMRKARNL